MLIDVRLFSRYDGSRTNTRTADDDDSLLGSLGKCCFICFVDRAIARARVDDALCACSDSRIDEGSIGTSRAVDDIDFRQRGQLADIELTLDRVQADWRGGIMPTKRRSPKLDTPMSRYCSTLRMEIT